MKTPRELILEHHQSAEAKLKAIRAEHLSACARSAAAEASGDHQSTSSLSAIAAQLWQDLFWPWRRVWAGVAATWLVILGLGLATGEMPRIRVARLPQPDPEMLAALRQQEQLLTQLLGGPAPPPVSRPRTPGPRSAAEPPPATLQGPDRQETTLRAEILALA